MTTPTSDLTYTEWTLTETQFNPDRLHARETVFTIGNGYLSTRGSFEEGYPDALPATLIQGVYDDLPVFYEELANCPDWSALVLIVDGDRLGMQPDRLLSYRRTLDLHRGILSRTVRWQSPAGKVIDLHFERFASLADEHVLAVRCQMTAIGSDLTVELAASLNGYAENAGFNHWKCLDQGQTDHSLWLQLQTRTSAIELDIACRVTLSGAEACLTPTHTPGYPSLTTVVLIPAGQTVTLDKLVTVYTSRGATAPLQAAQTRLAELPAYDQLVTAHQQAWRHRWDDSDIQIEGDLKAQLAVRYNLFQLLISAPRRDGRVSIPPKTLSGFGYRGHIFWDAEIFILPFFIYTQPDLARNLLTYRYHTLQGARRKANAYHYRGAMFAWESATTGDDVTPRWALSNDPYAEDIPIWCRDREIHITAAVAYAIWHYWQATQDDDWMQRYGAEIILDTAIFWMSRVQWNSHAQRYEIREVIGADEYHEYVHNNAFTNRMAQWHLEKAIVVYHWLKQTDPQRAATLEQTLDLAPDQHLPWQEIVAHLWIPQDESTGLMEQFEGFFKLTDLDLAAYEPRTKSMQAILGVAGANQYQVLKQPDVLMLYYLMRQCQEPPYNLASLKTNWEYYAPRTDITYGSSLGPAIHAILAADLNQQEQAYTRLMQAALVDLEDGRGNAADGIHAASAGGVWQAIVFGFGGLHFTDRGPVAQPRLPAHWSRLAFKLHWHGAWHQFELTNP